MTKTVKGRVQAVSDKEEDDYFGICIDDEWYNGPDSLQKDLTEAEVELEVNENEESFIDIEQINILEEDNEDGQSRTSNARSGGDDSNSGNKTSSSTNMDLRQANITAQSATKLAVENAETSYNENKAKHLEEVDERSQAYQNIMKDRMRENL